MADITIQNCQFGYKCEMKWEDLDSTSKVDIRVCFVCTSTVTFCHTDDELADAVREGRCVAIQRQGDHRGPTLGVIAPIELEPPK